jgi:hypothetical protein
VIAALVLVGVVLSARFAPVGGPGASPEPA